MFVSASKSTVTPMMAQFLEIKSEYPDALLFYRMGDFYEMFFDDAVHAAEALDIALTKRGKHNGDDIPMCGVPHHAAEGYFLTLIRKGFRVAVCEQLESPEEAKKRGYKSVVKRGVVRLVTPGTLTEDSLLNARHHNYLCACTEVRGEFALAWTDVSTGDFLVQSCPRIALGPLLARLAPKEVLITDALGQELHEIIEDAGAAITELSPASFDSTAGTDRLQKQFGVKSLDGFGQFARAELGALGAIVDYLAITQKGKLPLLRPPIKESANTAMQIDAATRRNLEITHNLSGGRDSTLLRTIDRTVTGGGARLLERRLTAPSTNITTINARLDAVGFFTQATTAKDIARDALKQTPDMDRALSRISLDRAGPRDLSAIQKGLEQGAQLANALCADELPQNLIDACNDLQGHDELFNALGAALVLEPPLLARDGGFVADGYNGELDEARKLRDEGRKVISAHQAEYSTLTGINALKIKHNNVLGYFIETPATHASKMLSDKFSDKFIHRQTTANAVRFTTVELSELETKILNAGGRALEIEKQIFTQLCSSILEQSDTVSVAAKALAEIDLSSALADLANGDDWVRPKLLNDRTFNIVSGRHPVVESALRRDGNHAFVANDCDLSADGTDAKPAWLLTGPNMAGKSTFLRQNALIALLAQMGSFVPAASAEIGVVTQLFSRVGASDDLARGRSTFMVEMVETAAILNQANDGALVILDEIGRGTATYDGLSIAWATLEHLHDVNKCRTLFATHYHELTGLTSQLSGLMNATVSVREWEGDIIFLHEVKRGAADRSYGVQVAKLAGLPAAVIERARSVLEKLEDGAASGGGKTQSLLDELPLFNATPTPAQPAAKESEIENAIRDILPDELTPKDALALIYELRGKLD
ncbi:DNA mismatch repair protein MutS [Paramylibacter ulvae]|uniref:DNA mismatch repair protein MutS n=1 Tax=Paramylibacter ulvae TaxID=1651968 RepID=UPI001E4FA892|nr:DNA mismatch repair protein MutS [Amylibacter ulvae]